MKITPAFVSSLLILAITSGCSSLPIRESNNRGLASFDAAKPGPFPKQWAIDAQIPPCPDTGVTVLDNTYPALAHITTQEGQPAFAEAVLNDVSARYEPWVIIYSSQKDYSKIANQLAPAARGQLRLAPLATDMASENTWVQDFFASFVEPKSGIPQLALLRDGDDDNHAPAEFSSIYKALHGMAPQIRRNENFISWDRLNPSPLLDISDGGDIAALPGGYCLHGSRQSWSGLAEKYCGKRENEIVLDTDWLLVGHVDEVVAVIPTSGAQVPCGFAIAFPSPAHALELLTDQDWKDSYIAGRLTNAKTNQQAVVTASQAAQAKIDVIKAVIQAKLHARISACKIEFVDLPVLYMPADRPDPTNYKGPRLQASTAFTANLVNASIQGLTYVTQDPVLEGLRKDAIDSLTKVGVKNVAWVGDDFASKHGGVHCASHSIRVCRFRSRP